MNKKHEHNAKLIMTVKDVQVAQTKSLPPRTFVIAQGEARTNATNPRLVLRKEPTIPEMLQLDFEADHGHIEVITPVTAVYELDVGHGFNQVTVHAETNSVSREVPPATSLAGKTGVEPATYSFSFNNTVQHMVLIASADETIDFVNDDTVEMTVGTAADAGKLFAIGGQAVATFDVKPGKDNAQRVKVQVPEENKIITYAITFTQKAAKGDVLNVVKGHIKVKGTQPAAAR